MPADAPTDSKKASVPIEPARALLEPNRNRGAMMTIGIPACKTSHALLEWSLRWNRPAVI